MEERFGEGVGVREEIGREWEEEGRSEGKEYGWDEPGKVYQDCQPEVQTDNETGYDIPYGGSTPPWGHPYPALDSPFTDYTYAAPSQWIYQTPPLSPLLQPEMVANHPYPVAPIFHWSTRHTHTPLPATRTHPGDEISCQLTGGKPSPKGHPSQPNQPGKSPGGLTIRRPHVVRTSDRGRELMVVGREEEREKG